MSTTAHTGIRLINAESGNNADGYSFAEWEAFHNRNVTLSSSESTIGGLHLDITAGDEGAATLCSFLNCPHIVSDRLPCRNQHWDAISDFYGVDRLG